MMRSPLRLWKKALLGVGVIFLGIQLVPGSRSNPKVTGGVVAPAKIEAILRRSCQDCHSHETRWPWYAYVAPASWLLEHDVEEGRERLDFSSWDGYAPGRRAKLFKEIQEEIDEGSMPPWYYVAMHPSARLSEEDRGLLRAWTEAGSRE